MTLQAASLSPRPSANAAPADLAAPLPQSSAGSDGPAPGRGFADALAAQPGAPGDAQPADAAIFAATASVTALPDPAAILPQPGKVLPEPAEPAPQPAPAKILETIRFILMPATQPGSTAAKPAKAAEAKEPVEEATAADPVAGAQVTVLPVVLPAGTVLPLPAAPAPVDAGTPTASQAPAPAAAPPVRNTEPAQHQPEQPANVPAAPKHSAFDLAALAALPAEQPEAASPPALTATAAPALDPVGKAPGVPAAPAAADLAQVVDAIARARAEAQPHSVHMAIRHAEFGPVSLRFEQDRGDLTVAMTSPDPEFARAVTAAAPTERSASSGGDAAQRFGASPDQSGSARSGTNPRGEGRPASRPASDRMAPPASDPSTGDIFA